VKRCSALVTALCFAFAPACKEDPAPPDATATSPATPSTSAPATPSTAPVGTPVEKPATPEATLAIAPSYPAELDPLLDLVPAGAEQFVVVRDLNEVLDDSRWLLEALRPALLRAMALDDSPDEDAIRVVKDFDALRGKFASSGIDFDRGVVVVGNGEGSDVLVFASANPEAMNELAVALGATAKPMKCAALTAVAGFVACAEKDDGTLAKYVPAKAAAALRDELGKALPDVDLEHANLLGRWIEPPDRGVKGIAIATVPGLVEVHVAPTLDDEFEAYATPGSAPALALAPRGSSFVWGRFAPSFLTDKAKSAPAIIGNVAATLTGEYFYGSLADPVALVVLVGVSDPGPLAALVPMFSLVEDKVPKALPDGTALAMKVVPVDAGTGSSVQTLHATASGPRADLVAKLGLVQEGVAFVAGKYGALVIGAGTSVVGRIAAFDGTAKEAPVTSGLPPGLATALRDGKASLAVHLELDGLHNPTLREVVTQVLGELPPPPGGKATAKDLLEIALGVIAPLSATSVWITGDGPSVVHVALRSFADPSSDEGKAAHAALVEIGGGTRDAKTVYAELAARYPSSARALAYTVRAEGTAAAIAPALGGAVLTGMLVYFTVVGREEKTVEAVAVPR